jgi:tetratricopeptide (TPR) repeat protein
MKTSTIAAVFAPVLFFACPGTHAMQAGGRQGGEDAAHRRGESGKDEPGTVTWSRDIAPLAYAHCTTCHHSGGAGPFSLITYADARRWAAQIASATQSHFMPPWLPEPGYGDFADVRRLSDRDVDLIRRWVKAGMPQGNAADAPAAPHYDATWQLGKPDLIMKVARPFTLPAGGTDVFRNFVLPYPLAQTHFIRAIEIVPGTPQVVHHANVIIDRTAGFRRQHPNDWESGVPGMELLVDSGNRFDPDSHFLFWKPDTPALIEPDDMPWRLDPGNDLILNMHLKPSGKPETLDAQVGLYFTDRPPTKQPMLLQLDRDDALDIPAGDAHFVVEDELKLPVAVDVLGVYPHAHYLGRDLEGWAILPNGEKKWLVWIRNWDIDRQSVYRYKEPLRLPKGTVLHMRYTYDNSTANIHNPHSPPVRVRAGNRSEDEMSHLWLQVLPVDTAPNGRDPRLVLEEAWMRNRLRKSPDDRVSLYNLAAALAGEGKYSAAVAAFERDLSVDPRDARTLTALGVALDGAGEWQQAQERFRGAIASAGSDTSAACDARYDLASSELRHEQAEAAADFRTQVASCAVDAAALVGLAQTELAANQTASAAGDLKKAIAVDPSSVDAHEQLARADAMGGDLQGALAELRSAAELRPNDATIHSGLSQVMAATGDLPHAIEEQRLALKLDANDADGWNNLGVMEARTGEVPAAREAFEQALRIDPRHAQAKANLARLNSQN